MSSRQLEMNFNGVQHGNAFKEHLDNAEFSVLLELRIPGRDSKLESVVSRYSELESVVSSRKVFPAGLAFLEDSPDFPSLDPGEFAAALCKSGRDRHLIYVNGRNRRPEDIDYNLGIYRFEGFRNIAAVSGIPSSSPEETAKLRYYDSVNILQRNACSKTPLFAGCVANPYKYNRTDSILQYCKLSKKIAAGASFVVAQSGWDMRKLLEMRWCIRWHSSRRRNGAVCRSMRRERNFSATAGFSFPAWIRPKPRTGSSCGSKKRWRNSRPMRTGALPITIIIQKLKWRRIRTAIICLRTCLRKA